MEKSTTAATCAAPPCHKGILLFCQKERPVAAASAEEAVKGWDAGSYYPNCIALPAVHHASAVGE